MGSLAVSDMFKPLRKSVIVIVAIGLATLGHANDWNVNSSGNWATGGNWCGGVPCGVDAVANFDCVITANRCITLCGPHTVGTLSIDDNNNYSLIGASTLTLDVSAGNASIAVSSANGNGSHSIAHNIALNDGVDISNASSGTLTLSGVISGAQTVNYSGTGSISICGANTYSGGTVIDTSNILIGNNCALGTCTVTISGDVNIQSQGGSRTLGNNIVLNGGSQFTVDGANNLTLDGDISGGGVFKKCGTGTLRLNGNNSMANVANSITLEGNTWKQILLCYTVTACTVLEYCFSSTSQGELHGIGFDTDNSISSNRTFKNHGTQNWGITTYDNYSGSGTTHYTIPVGTHFTGCFNRLTFMMDHDAAPRDGNMTISNIQIHEGTPGSIIDFSCYTINSYGGGQDSSPVTISTSSASFELNSGTLELGHDSALGCTSLEVNGGSITAVGAGRCISNVMVVNNDFTINDGQSLTWSGNISLGNTTSTITVNNTSDTSFTGVISDGVACLQSGGLTKAGTGKLTIGGTSANTYSGTTTVTGGELALSKTAGVNAIAGNITISTGAVLTLENDNQIADSADIILNGGTLALTGTESINDLTLSADSTIDMGGGNVNFTVLGDLDLNGHTLNVTNYIGSYSGGGADQFHVNGSINNTGNIIFSSGGSNWAAGFQQLGSEVVPAPEASTWVSFGVILVMAVGFEYRRRKKVSRSSE